MRKVRSVFRRIDRLEPLSAATTTTLLDGLFDVQNAAAWQRFTSRFCPVLMAFARKLGLSKEDAEDATQEALAQFIRAYREGHYQRQKGRLRSWLFKIAENQVLSLQRRKGREIALTDLTAEWASFKKMQSTEVTRAIWDQEWDQLLLRECVAVAATRVSPETLKAFELYFMKEWPVEKVAETLGITKNAVYIAKNRVLSHIRQVRDTMLDGF
jgi:RNA polymerase sigma factor (sigma-70 family)